MSGVQVVSDHLSLASPNAWYFDSVAWLAILVWLKTMGNGLIRRFGGLGISLCYPSHPISPKSGTWNHYTINTFHNGNNLISQPRWLVNG
jgi:hypothetical protein